MKSLRLRNRFLAVCDILICFVAYFLIFLLLYDKNNTFYQYYVHLKEVCVSAIIFCGFLTVFNVYKTDWVYAGYKEYFNLIFACVASVGLGVIAGEFFPGAIKLTVAANIGSMIGICLCRFFVRLLYNFGSGFTSSGAKRVLVIGAGHLAVAFLRDLTHNKKLNYKIVGLIDDDENKKKINIYGAKVLGNRNDIERICSEKDVEEIIFAIYTLSPKDKTDLLNICSHTGKKVRILQSLAANINDIGTHNKEFRDIDIEDLLERDAIHLDNRLIEGEISGKVVLVTGAGGSIGSELCRQIVKFKPSKLIILDIYENTTYELQNELEEDYPELNLITLIASVRDKRRLDNIFNEHKPNVVFHAAAHKHVPLMEDSPCETIKNNVLGTYNAALCAKEFGVESFVLISTDKAVNPTNIMGASKRMCEMIIQTMQKYSDTEFVAVRFGNVLGSNGSVIPRFKKQIEKGGPVTVTHPEITRFFMTIPEAAQLVLQAVAYANGGEIFVLDMGSPVKIYDLAKKMIRLSGFRPDEDIKIEFTGLRPGEKLYEELLMNEEGLESTAHQKIFVGKPGDLEIEQLEDKIQKLKSVVESDVGVVKHMMSEVVPTYHIYEEKEEQFTAK